MAATETPLVNVAEITDWMDEDRVEFVRMVNERQLWKLNRDEADKIIKDLDNRIMAMMLLSDRPMRILSDMWVVQRVTNNGRETLSQTRLLELGVSANVIKQATVEGQPFSYVLIKPSKE